MFGIDVRSTRMSIISKKGSGSGWRPHNDYEYTDASEKEVFALLMIIIGYACHLIFRTPYFPIDIVHRDTPSFYSNDPHFA